MSRYPKSNPRWRMIRGLSTPNLRRIYRTSQSAGAGQPTVEQTDYPHVREMIRKVLEAVDRDVEAWNHRQAREHVLTRRVRCQMRT